MPEESLPRHIGGRFRPTRLIARGGMGMVYLVEHEHTGEQLALKVLIAHGDFSSLAAARFRREARSLAKIKSEHVVRIYDADVSSELNGAPFLVMEYLQGVDLERATQDAPQDPKMVVDWLRQAANGLSVAHAHGIVHRDLKPENLFLTRTSDGRPLIKILDFGIAKLNDEDCSKHTHAGMVVGTPLYMSFEQVSGEALVTQASDQWSFAMIAFRLLSGITYWNDGPVARTLAQIVYEPIEPPSKRGLSLGQAFDDWFVRSTNRIPEARFATIDEQVRELERALAGAEGLARQPSRQPKKRTSAESIAPTMDVVRTSLDPLAREPHTDSTAMNAQALRAPRAIQEPHSLLSQTFTQPPEPPSSKSRKNVASYAFAICFGILLTLIAGRWITQRGRAQTTTVQNPINAIVTTAKNVEIVEKKSPPQPEASPNTNALVPESRPVASAQHVTVSSAPVLSSSHPFMFPSEISKPSGLSAAYVVKKPFRKKIGISSKAPETVPSTKPPTDKEIDLNER